ncbi:DNA repair protein RadC [Paenibacillus thiaminolyticus]|uniref:RadC family protein n=1 Tax=Paenibacillus thiaminolyticus TaxID=49283 RepID=UPI00234FCB74|nr:DNA repair protein RadC [Paenibacillus thiaminolyticus]WCR29483.1 DNA repair protein RadC [Paenibacillus thiaminolyticus]
MSPNKREELKQLISESLRERPDSYTIQSLFEHFPTIPELMDASEPLLMNIKGIGWGKARQLTAMFKLVKTLSIPTYQQCTIRSPKDAFDLLEPELRFSAKEQFVCLFLNTKNRVIHREIVSVGTLNAAIVHPREVFRAAIKRCSASLICAQNHPSGDSTPSPEDVELTKRLVSVGEIIGIEVLDHIIIGAGNFVSLKERGLM